MRQIDPEWYAVVDLGSGNEIAGAVAADEDTGEVYVIRPTHNGPEQSAVYRHAGVKIVRRRTREKLNPNVYGNDPS